LIDIERGLDYVRDHYQEWKIVSIACPPLGCGNGGLQWSEVGPLIYRKLHDLDIDPEVYAPFTPSTLIGWLDDSVAFISAVSDWFGPNMNKTASTTTNAVVERKRFMRLLLFSRAGSVRQTGEYYVSGNFIPET
jgi:hypothetical protein